MSRSNPGKKKRRYASTTLLMYGEGLCEEVFLKHLKGIYYCSQGVAIKIEGGRGGSAPDTVKDAVRMMGSFDRKVVVLDSDKSLKEMTEARTMAAKYGIILIENNPCLEATFLVMLLGNKFPRGKASDWYKKKFESEYIDRKKRGDLVEYKKVFDKKLLDVQRSKVKEIDALIVIMESP